MPELPKRKIGLVSCSGEEMAEGTVTRLATLRVLESLRPDETVPICLPLFLAGGEGERAFARHYPTITIDGCDQRCAARGTEMYSARPAASIVVTELCPGTHGDFGTARRLSSTGVGAINQVAQEIVRHADRLLGIPWDRKTGRTEAPAEPAPEKLVTTCSCGSGIPVKVVEIHGHKVEVLALAQIFEMFRKEARPAGDATAAELLENVRLYNRIPEGEEASWKQALGREYASYCGEER